MVLILGNTRNTELRSNYKKMTKEEKIFFKTILSVLGRHKKASIESYEKTISYNTNDIGYIKTDLLNDAKYLKEQREVISFLNRKDLKIPKALLDHLTITQENIEGTIYRMKDNTIAIKSKQIEIKEYGEKVKAFKTSNPDIKSILIDEYEKIKELINDGTIESVEYDPAKGIIIIFPGRIYDRYWFTGRVRCVIHDPQVCQRGTCSKLVFTAMSYTGKTNINWHIRDHDNWAYCNLYCPGGFRELFEEAFNNRLLSQIIYTINAYLDSADPLGKFNDGPSYKAIIKDDFTVEGINDNSWEDFKKTDAFKQYQEDLKTPMPDEWTRLRRDYVRNVRTVN